MGTPGKHCVPHKDRSRVVSRVIKHLEGLGHTVDEDQNRRFFTLHPSNVVVSVRVSSSSIHKRQARISGRPGKFHNYEYEGWVFNFHVHGKRLKGIDFYVCVQCRKNGDTFWIIPSERISGLTWSLLDAQRPYRGQYADCMNAWHLLPAP